MNTHDFGTEIDMTNGHDQDNSMNPSQDQATSGQSDAAGSDDIAREAAQIAALHAEIADLKERYLRALADTDNLRKRAEREKQDAAQFAFSRFARDLLAVADNFERALDVMKPEKRAALSGETLSVIEGIEATHRQLVAVFERFAVKKIDAMGKKFNPNFHEAIAEIPNPSLPAGTVFAVAENGYLIGERLLRAAKVAITSSSSQHDGSVDTSA